MNSKQDEESRNEEKDPKKSTTDENGKEHRARAGKHVGNSGTVMADINDDPRKKKE